MLTELGKIETFQTQNLQIRFFKSQSQPQPQGTIVILQGRSSYLEKYEAVIQNWIRSGFDVYALDWPGQGGSSRFLEDPLKVHIETYSIYLETLHAWLKSCVLETAKKPVLFYASSIGALIATRYLQEASDPMSPFYSPLHSPSHHPIAGLILIAPCFGLLTWPFPNTLAKWISRLACLGGLKESFVFGYRRKFQEESVSPEILPLITQGLTFGWLLATFDALDLVRSPSQLSRLQIPVLLVQAGLDKDVDNKADQKVVANLKNCQKKLYADAPHAINNSTLEIQKRLHTDCLEFIRLNVF